MAKSEKFYNEKAILSYITDKEKSRLTYSEAKEALLELAESTSSDCDFYITVDGSEYRIIHDSVIWGIYVEEIQNIVEDCYDLNLDKIPNFVSVSIDWEQTAKNAYVDGYGHTFASYDGEEKQVGQFWVFRTN